MPAVRTWTVEDRGFSSPCWIWQGPTDKRLGYGTTCRDGRAMKAHRWSYEEHVGPIPDGLVIDHLCRVPACVNPEHLEPVTQRENLLRGNTAAARGAALTHCKRGHPFNEENTYRNRKGGRECRACTARRQRGHKRGRKIQQLLEAVSRAAPKEGSRTMQRETTLAIGRTRQGNSKDLRVEDVMVIRTEEEVVVDLDDGIRLIFDAAELLRASAELEESPRVREVVDDA